MIRQIVVTDYQNDDTTTYSIEEGASLRLGASAQNEIYLPSPFVSQYHAVIMWQDGDCTITDLGSKNGTQINNELITEKTAVFLNTNDTIEIGLYQLHYQIIESTSEPTDTPLAIPKKPNPALPPPSTIELNGSDPHYHQRASQLGFHPDKSRLIEFLPAIYNTPYMNRFLALFETFIDPISWRIDHFDLFMDATSAPSEFLPWLAQWYGFTFDHTWNDTQKRAFLKKAPAIYQKWGTPIALQTLLTIYTGQTNIKIIDQDQNLPVHTFRVELDKLSETIDEASLKQLINNNKPAHTTYTIQYREANKENEEE